MNKLRELFSKGDKKAAVNLVTILIVGVVLLIISSSYFMAPKTQSADTDEATDHTVEDSGDSYERQLEKRLEEIFSQAEGVGKVKVMITLAYGREIILAEDVVKNESDSKETDSQGGTRETSTSSTDGRHIILTDKNGDSRPLILKELSPKIEGVIVVAEGGDNIYVKDALTKAAGALLGIELHKIQILKME